MDTANLLEIARLALRSGHRKKARTILMQVIRQDPYSEKGWLWLSGAIENPDEQRYCLVQVMSINPTNQIAVDGLERLGPGSLQSPLEDSNYYTQTEGNKETQPEVEGVNSFKANRQFYQPELTPITPNAQEITDTSEKKCLNCKTHNPVNHKYCDHCGRKF